MCETESECYRKLILNTERPIVFRNRLDWDQVSWCLDDWCDIFEEKALPFRCGTRSCEKACQWERFCQTEHYKFEDFVNLTRDQTVIDKWWYFDYKHIEQWFKQCDRFKFISWKNFGFPEKTAADSTIWVGSTGAHTPCHMDTYGCNIVGQVYGRKRWILFPPSETKRLKPTRVPYEESSIYSQVNFSCCENFKDIEFEKCCFIDLNPGDVLCVPPRWWHYVENVSTAISINMWIAHENDDSWRLEESLVKYVVSSVTSALSDEAKYIILNPNEDHIDNNLTCLKIIEYCLDKCAKSRIHNDTTCSFENVTNESHHHAYQFVSFIEHRKLNAELNSCSCKQSSNKEDKEKLNITPEGIKIAVSVINAFCHPDVISIIKDKMLC